MKRFLLLFGLMVLCALLSRHEPPDRWSVNYSRNQVD